jgi:hypothetical protein
MLGDRSSRWSGLELILDCGNYSLRNSFASSFISSLYESLGPDAWVKVAGNLGGRLKLEQGVGD